MVYKITFDSFTKISEQAGTLQNIKFGSQNGNAIEVSHEPVFNSGILVEPGEKHTFSGTDIYLRCDKEGQTAEVRVVPFSVDVGGGDDSSVDTTALKSVALVGNALNFYTSSDTAQAAAYSIDIPAEQFVDQTTTNFVPNFYFSAILYPDAVNPNLNGKPVFVLGVKTKSNDGQSSSTKYSFIDMSKLVDIYVESDTSVTVSDYKFKVNISTDEKNALKLKANGLYADGVTDTATASSLGLTKLYGTTGANTDGTLTQSAITTALAAKLDSDATAAAAFKDSSGNVITDTYATKTALSTGLNSKLDSDATAAAAFKDSSGNVITDTYVTKSELSHKLGAVRYGYRIRKDEADPDLRVEYLYDAAGMRPAHMVWDTDTATAGTDSDTSYFDYGDWQSVWFVRDNKPCMLKYDGSVDYYLDPDDYTKRETPLEVTDGTDTVIVTDTDVSNTSYDGNAMAQFPLCWIYRYEDDDYLYEIVSNVQWDENYKAYAHTDKDGNIKDYFYHALFEPTLCNGKFRCLKDKTFVGQYYPNQRLSYSQANGSGWCISSWSQYQLLRSLLTLISNSTNSQAVFGNGRINSAGSYITTDTLSNKGQFFGFNDSSHNVKVFHIESLWGNRHNLIVGALNSKGNVYVKMTPEGNGYQLIQNKIPSDYHCISSINKTTGYLKSCYCNEYGMFPRTVDGSSSTYFCDVSSLISTNGAAIYFGGSCHEEGMTCGIHFFSTFDGWWRSHPGESTFLAYV